MEKKKIVQGSLQLIVILIAVIITISMCTGNEEEAADSDWISTPTFKITDDMDLETEAMYITLNTFTPEERLNPKGLPIIEKEMTLGSEVKINNLSDNTKILSLKIRNNTLGGNLELTKTNTARILKNITPFLIDNNISGLQFEWTTPSKLNGAEIEPYYYVIRFETSTLSELNLDTLDFNNLESYASYTDVN